MTLRNGTSSNPMDSLQAQGQQAYKQGEYVKALSIFTRAIEKTPSVRLFDSRAACHEKIGDLKAALKDAKAAIKTHRNDPTGYLRAGRILVKMEKSSTALEIYTHGLKSVKHIGQGYEKLQKAEQDLMDVISPPRRRDPLRNLPLELAELILEYLTFKQRMNACLVSKQWAHLIRSLPRLWRHCDLSETQRKVRSAFISSAINAGRDKLTVVTLNNLYDFDKSLLALVKHCPIEELTLQNTGPQDKILVDILRRSKTLRAINILEGTSISADAISTLCAALAQQIEKLDCFLPKYHQPILLRLSCPNLRVLSLNISDPIASESLQLFFNNVAEHLPNLECFVMCNRGMERRTAWTGHNINLRACKNLQKLHLFVPLIALAGNRLPHTIRSLSLICSGTNLPGIFFDPEIYPLSCHNPYLEELTLDFWTLSHAVDLDCVLFEVPQGVQPADSVFARTMSEQEILPLTKDTTVLRKLTLKSMSELTDTTFANILSHRRLRFLEHLGFPNCSGLDDVQLGAVLSLLPSLQSLDVSKTDITGVGLKAAVLHGKIRTINVSNCRFLGVDAVLWARSQGIHVQHDMSKCDTGGRRVRYRD